MIVGKLDICVGGRVVKLESKAHDSLMKVICPHLGGCFIGMMGGKRFTGFCLFDMTIKNGIMQHMKCKKCGRWINDFHDRRCPARSDSGDNRVKENECKEKK